MISTLNDIVNTLNGISTKLAYPRNGRSEGKRKEFTYDLHRSESSYRLYIKKDITTLFIGFNLAKRFCETFEVLEDGKPISVINDEVGNRTIGLRRKSLMFEGFFIWNYDTGQLQRIEVETVGNKAIYERSVVDGRMHLLYRNGDIFPKDINNLACFHRLRIEWQIDPQKIIAHIINESFFKEFIQTVKAGRSSGAKF